MYKQENEAAWDFSYILLFNILIGNELLRFKPISHGTFYPQRTSNAKSLIILKINFIRIIKEEKKENFEMRVYCYERRSMLWP